MAEYIEKESLMVALCKEITGDGDYYNGKDDMQDQIRDMVSQFPAADVAPVRHAHWETNSDRPDSLICSVCKCGFDMWKHDPHNYCPNCGAKMQE